MVSLSLKRPAFPLESSDVSSVKHRPPDGLSLNVFKPLFGGAPALHRPVATLMDFGACFFSVRGMYFFDEPVSFFFP